MTACISTETVIFAVLAGIMIFCVVSFFVVIALFSREGRQEDLEKRETWM